MSFSGFDTGNLERERQQFLDGVLHENEDIAVYTWGEESYDGLGDALQEGGDELNDETFGDTGAVGKDFDFSNPALPGIDLQPRTTYDLSESNKEPAPQFESKQRQAQEEYSQFPALSSQASRPTTHSLEAIWDDKSPFSILPRANGSARTDVDHPKLQTTSSGTTKFSPFSVGDESPIPSHRQPSVHGLSQTGVRTLQEIEAEMRLAAQQSREETIMQRQLLQQQQQQQLLLQRQQEQERQLLRQQEQEIELLQRQRLLQEQQQLQLQQLQRLQHQYAPRDQHQHLRTPPPPRMLPMSQSPRFHEHQRQILMLQQQQEQQQQQRLQELQEQLKMEEIERQLKAQQLSQLNRGPSPSHYTHHRRTPSGGPVLSELQAAQLLQHHQQQQFANHQQRRQHSQSPGVRETSHYGGPFQQAMPYLPQNIQLQQRLLSEMAHAQFLREMQGGMALTPAEQEALRAEAIRKILEAEKMEEKRRRKAAKIAHMSRYNDLMTQSDKDFITRIQVSQLVTQDPYAEDFYAQVYGAILRSRMGLQSQDERVLKFGSGGGVGLGPGQKGGGRRPSAMQRMEQQVERIVNNARRREEEKGLHALHNLQGALGKTSGRSYKAAPRQLLQVESGNTGVSPTLSHAHAAISKDDSLDHAREAAKLGREALGDAADTAGVVRKDPLTHREVLVMLEGLYDLVLRVEQLRRDQPLPDDHEAVEEWQAEYDQLVELLWDGLKVLVPLETSDPHPFISLLGPTKGKRLLPRLTRHLSSQQLLTVLTLLVACFSQLDVIKQAPLLDSLEDSKERSEAERQTQAFLSGVLQSILPVISKAALRLVSGFLGLLLDRSDVVKISQTRPGLALLTLFLSRVEVIKQTMSSSLEVEEVPSPEEAQQWQLMFDHLFQLLSPYFMILFPSTRLAPHLPPGHANGPTDIVDQPVWQFLAALALHASSEQQQILVSTLREKILDNVVSVNNGWVTDEEEKKTKLANVNLFLHALGLDSSQITL